MSEKTPTPAWFRYVFVFFCISVILTEHFIGPFAMTRLFGAYWIAAALWSVFAPELPISVGDVEVARLKGWHKAFLIVPVLCIGAAVIVYAPELTCSMRGYKASSLCAPK